MAIIIAFYMEVKEIVIGVSGLLISPIVTKICEKGDRQLCIEE
jgi:hypothetical protein